MTSRRAVLDTSVLIDYPAETVADLTDEVAVSAISLAELHYGVPATADPIERMQRRRRAQWVRETFELLPFDTDTAEHYGALTELIRQQGRNPRRRRMDLQIAATAVQYGTALLTRNGDDFIGLESAVTIHHLARVNHE